jgi:hypothetical protein
MMLFTLATQLLAFFGDDDEDPLTLNIFGVPIKFTAYNPISSFLLLANFFKRAREGREPLKNLNEIYRLFGVDTRYPNLAFEWIRAVVDLGAEYDNRKWAKADYVSRQIGGKAFTSYLKALTTIKDIQSHFDPEEATVRDYYDSPFLGEFKKTLPFSEALTRLITGENSLFKVDAKTGQALKKENTLLDQFGITIIPSNEIGAKFSPVEEYLDDLLRTRREKHPKIFKNPAERRSSGIAAQLYTVLDKGELSPEEFQQRLTQYFNEGNITERSSTNLVSAAKYPNNLQRKAFDATLTELSQAYDFGNSQEQLVIKQIMVIKAEVQIKAKTLSDDEFTALSKIFTKEELGVP